MTSAGSAARLSLTKKLAFSLVATLVLLGVAELALLVAGVRPVIWDEDPYVGFESSVELFRPAADPAFLETAPNKLALFNTQRFPRRKPAGATRIFTLGGSTTYGRPFDDPTSFSGWLREYLSLAAPDREWEVINAGAISYASYRVAKLMEELLAYQPDVFVIYSGNNEFLEQRSYAGIVEEPAALTRLRLALSHSRLYSVARKVRRARRDRARERYRLKGEVDELLNRSTGLDVYKRDDRLTEQIVAHYRFNLYRMVDMARSVGAGVVLVTVPVNEKDFAPFKSQASGESDPATRTRVRELLSASATSEAAGQLGEALRQSTESTTLDPRYADAWYRLGRVSFEQGRFDDARSAFIRAIVEDVCPLRALPAMNAALREVAADRRVALVDFEELLRRTMEQRHGHRLLGEELFLDHVHPTVEANGLLARALVDRLAADGHVELDAAWHDRVGSSTSAAVQARVDDAARARAFKNLSKVLIWAGKQAEAERYIHRAESLGGDDWEVHHNAGVVALRSGDVEAALERFDEALRRNPAAAETLDYRAIALAELGRFDEAVAAGTRAAELAPDRPAIHNNLATILLDAGRPVAARAAAARALELAPDFAEAHNSAGNAWLAEGRPDAALASYDRALALRPGYADALINRGQALGATGRFSEAEEAFAQAVRADDTAAAAYLGLGRARLARNDAAGAIAAFESALAIEPSAVAHENLARALAAAGRLPDANVAVQRGLSLAPGSPGLLELAARLATARQDFEGAIVLLRQAIDAFPRADSPTVEADDLHQQIAGLLLMTGRTDEGVQQLERALTLNPDNVRALNDLGLVYESGGRYAEAAERYRRALELEPRFDLAAENLRRVQQRTGAR